MQLRIASLASVALLASFAGAQTLVKDINTTPAPNPGSAPGSQSVDFLRIATVQSGFHTYWVAETAANGRELYFSFASPTLSTAANLVDVYPGVSSSRPAGLFDFNGSPYFWATGPGIGRELYRFDVNANQAFLVADINPGAGSASLGQERFIDHDYGTMAEVNGELLFLVDEPTVAGLYKTTGSGATLLKALTPVAAIDARRSYYTFSRGRIASAGSYAYFGADDGTGSGTELWRSDGTAAGTTMVADINPGAESSNPDSFVAFGSSVVFKANDGATGDEPFVSDGTAIGTQQLMDVDPGPGSGDPINFAVGNFAGGAQVVFSAYDATNGAELYISDGTPAGTMFVADLAPGLAPWGWPNDSDPRFFVPLGNKVYFAAGLATPTGAPNFSLFETDGTVAGTVQVLDPVGEPNGIQELAVAGGKVWFYGEDDSGLAYGAELHAYDPTAGTFSMVAGDYDTQQDTRINHYVQAAHPSFNSLIFFADTGNGYEPQCTNGTTTVEMADLNPLNPSATLSADFDASGWRIENFGPNNWTHLGTKAYCMAWNGTAHHLYETDGTNAGTVAVSPAYAGSVLGSRGAYEFNPLAYQGRIYLAFDDGSGTFDELFSYDPQTSTFALCADVVGAGPAWGTFDKPEIVGFLGDIWFNGGSALQVYDPKTNSVTDMTIAAANAGNTPPATPKCLTPIGDKLYFFADDGSGMEPWVSDGTAAGTMVLADCNFGGEDALPYGTYGPEFARAGDKVVFGAVTDADGATPLGRELWVTDGTPAPAGTQLLVDINVGPGESMPWRWSQVLMGLTALDTPGGTIALFGADDGSGIGSELWRTDGTAAGTYLVKDIEPGAVGTFDNYWSVVSPRAVVNGKVLFGAWTTANATELWASDGTAAGTYLVKDINPGAGGGFWGELVPVGSRRAYFIANSPAGGKEIWSTNGTNGGTYQVTDVRPGNEGSNPGEYGGIGYVGNRLLFSADDGVYGSEIHGVSLGAVSMSVGSHPSRTQRTDLNPNLDNMGGGCVTTGLAPQVFANDAALGTFCNYGLKDAQTNTNAVLFVGWPAGPYTPPQFGGDACAFYLSPWLEIGIPTGPSGGMTLSQWVPNNPGLIGMAVALQAISIQANGLPVAGMLNPVAITNAVHVHIGL